MNDFDYLPDNVIYLDAACQSLRPRPVLDALNSYYEEHNSCGERVKYKWGRITDEKVEATREKVLKYLKLKPRDYFVSFTLNTTYGINLLLAQLDVKKAGIEHVITSDIEHNSPFLSTMTFAKSHHLPRTVITRREDGSVDPADIPERSLVVLNCASNLDGRRLTNIKEVIKHIHNTGGIIIIDAAQALAHTADVLYKTEADAICFSAHKMYAPSLGGIICRKDLLPCINTTFIGGGMVDDVDLATFQLSAENPDHIYTKFESGLQAWGEIIALGAAIDWLTSLPKSARQELATSSQELFDFLQHHPKFHLLNHEANPTTTFYVDKNEVGFDSHTLGEALGDEGIMARTGYFCVHYYLDHVKHYPPLIRFSMGYHTRPTDIAHVIERLSRLA